MDAPSDAQKTDLTEIDREKAIDYLESQFPALFEAAVRVAYWDTLASGHSLLEAKDGFIYEVFPDGSRKVVQQIEPRIPVVKGQVIELR